MTMPSISKNPLLKLFALCLPLFAGLGLLLAFAVQPAQAGPTIGDLQVRIIAAPNLVVDSNALTPSSFAPKVATVIGEFCNTSTTATINGVVGYIGDYTGSGPTGGTPAIYPLGSTNFLGADPVIRNYRFTHLGRTSDATRFIGSLGPGQCSYQYWSFSYPHTNGEGSPAAIPPTLPTWGGSVKPDDDLSLFFDVWGTYTGAGGFADQTHRMTMRNQISAMANKIEPNGNPPGAWFNTETSTVNAGDTITTNGILYRIGNVGAGFDNDGDGIPDRNAWLQPFGDPAYDPSCFRLISTSGVLTITRSSAPTLILPFENQLYFTNLPADNTDVRGVVYYKFLALGGVCTLPVSPYQTAASGYDNEKFNGDYGTGVPPLGSYNPTLAFTKGDDPDPVPLNGIVTYSLTALNPALDPRTGQPNSKFGLTLASGSTFSLMIQDQVPLGLQYINNSASAPATFSPALSNSIAYRRYQYVAPPDNACAWRTAEPGTDTTSSLACPFVIQWWLAEPMEAGESVTVSFQARVPAGFTGGPVITNCAAYSLADYPPAGSTCTTTQVSGNNSLGDTVFADTGAGTGGAANDGVQNGTEPGLNGVPVRLYSTFTVLDGLLDLNTNGVVNTADSGYLTVAVADSGGGTAFKTYQVINGFLDMNGDGTITAADNGSLPGAFRTFSVLAGRVDVDGDGAPGADLDDDATGVANLLLATATTANVGGVDGRYTFGSLADGRYAVVVDATHATFSSGSYKGYVPTTPDRYVIDLDPAGTNSSPVNRLDADFGFGPALTLDKILVTPNPAFETNTVTFRIVLRNTRPGDGTPSGFCRYSVYASGANQSNSGIPAGTPPGGGGTNKQWSDVQFALGAPDNRYMYDDMTDANELVGLYGFNTAAFPGAITSVTMQIYFREGQNFISGSQLIARVWDRATNAPLAGGTYTWSDTFFTGPSGTTYLLTQNITGLRGAWDFSHFSNNNTSVQLEANKGSGPDGGEAEVDAVVFLITTNDPSCGDGDYVMNPVPLTDTFDPARLQFLSATPPHSSLAGNTITWNNVGPIYGGGTREILVNFKALSPGTAPASTNNTATVTNAFYVSGKPVNDATDTEPVTVNPTGSIAGTVFIDANNNGWQGTGPTATGFEALGTTDFPLPGATVTLYGCYSSNPASGGTLITSYDDNKTCAAQSVGNSGWFPVPGGVTTTDLNGSYRFEGLRLGFYYVDVDLPAWASSATQTSEPIPNGANNGVTCTPGNCNTLWEPAGGTNTFSTVKLSTTAFNPIGNGNPLATPKEDITNVNFGFNLSSAYVYGKVYTDSNGDGSQGTGEGNLQNVPVTLYQCGLDNICGNGDDVVVQTAATAADGSYGFLVTPISGRNYYVQVTQPANTTQTDDPDNAGPCATNGGCDNRTTTPFTLVNGQVRGPYIFGYQPAGAYTIGDTVFVDWNGNGQQDAGEEGINGIPVYLYEDENNDGLVTPGVDALIASTVTNASGQYFFPNLPNGNYIVMLDTNSPNYPGTWLQTRDPEDTDGVCNTLCDNLGDAEINNADDLSNDWGFKPVGYSSIGDRVWQDTNGNGIQDAGETGLNGVTVRLYQDQNGDGILNPAEDALVATTATATVGGVPGSYSFTGLPAGNYIVQVDSAEFNSGGDLFGLTLSNTTAPYNIPQVSYKVSLPANTAFTQADFGFTASSLGDRVWRDDNGDGIQDLNEPGINGVTVQLFRAITILDGYVDLNADGGYANGLDNGTLAVDNGTFTIVGGLVYSGGAPYSGSLVILGVPYPVLNGRVDVNNSGTLTSADDLANLQISNTPLATATTATVNGISGYYSFGGLPAGSYVVKVNEATLPTGYTRTGDPDAYADPALPGCTGALYPPYNPAQTACYQSLDGVYATDLPLGSQNVAADFGYKPPVSFGDRVWFDANGNNLQDASEPGLPFITVRLCADLACSSVVATTSTDENGFYTFGAIPAGTYYVKVDANPLTEPDFPAGMVNTYDVDTGTDGTANNDSTTQVVVGPTQVTSVGGQACPDRTTDPAGYLACTLSADFGYRYLGTNTLTGTAWLDLDNGGQAGGTGDIDSTETGRFAGVEVYLFRGVAIIDGYFDINGDGLINAGDSGSLTINGTNYAFQNGVIDLNGDATFGNDTGTLTFPGVSYPVINGLLDVNGGGISATDDAPFIRIASIPFASATTDSAGTYAFTGLPNGTYMVRADSGSLALNGTLPTTTLVYNGTPPTNPAVSAFGGNTSIRDFGFNYATDSDLGDLPDTYDFKPTPVPGTTEYTTLLRDNGARHVRPTPNPTSCSGGQFVCLGATIDLDANGQPTTRANGDDLNGPDEDGVALPTNANWDSGTNGASLVFSTTGCSAGDPCFLSAWVDWNMDGDFYDAGERVLLDRPLTTSQETISFNVPNGIFTGRAPTYIFNVRARLYPNSTNGFAQPTGSILGGEVEDHQFGFGPTAITLLNFSAPAGALTPVFPAVFLLLATAGVILAGQRVLRHRRRH